MAFKNPIYLDTDLLSNLADYVGIDSRPDRDVTRKTSGTGTKGVGFDKIASGKFENTHAEEVTESYSLANRPVRLMNDLVDLLATRNELVDLDIDSSAALTAGSTIKISGDLFPSAANEVGAVMARFLPLLMSGLSSGNTNFNPTESQLASAFLNETGAVHPQLFELEAIHSIEGRPNLVIIDPDHMQGSSSLEDLEGDQTIVAHLERLVQPGSTVKLDKYIFPGLPRIARRAMSQGRDRERLLAGLDTVIGRPITPEDLEVHGPALMLRALAIF